MKKIVFALLIISSFSCTSQHVVNATKDASGNLVGIANKDSFLEEPFNDWFQPNYEYYQLDNEVITALKPYLNSITIKAFMGTWCGDSKEQTPVFYKILDACEFNYNKLQMITVNRAKSTPDNLQEGLDIQRVPTFIFYKNGKEIGRFVEYPIESVEKDMLKIVSGETYKHAYQN